MKKKTRLLILSVIATLAFSGAMASCGKKGGGNGGSSSSSQTSSSEIGGESSEVESESSEIVSDSSEIVSESSEIKSDSSDAPSQITVEINGGATVMEFETLSLTAIIVGSDDELTVEWTSSDDSIASVDQDGVVTAHKVGNVTITASVAGVSATHEVEVEPTDILHEIEFDLEEVKVYMGESETVEASVVFDGDTLDNDEYGLVYTWEKISGDEGVVTVATDGAAATFTANAAGTAIYKVSTTARGYAVDKTISVTVMENEYSYDIPNEKISMVEGGYKTSLTLIADATLDIGTVYGVKNGEPQEDELTVEWATDSDVISIESGVITALKAGEGVITGTTAYGGENLTITLTVAVAKNQVALSNTFAIEAAVTETITVPAEITEPVLKATIGNNVLFDAANGKGSLDGSTITVDKDGMPCKAADLGKGKTMTLETETTFYSVPVDVYTLIINNAEELDQWQAIAAENAVKEGICLEAQKGLVYSGYFVLGDNIEYNKVWKTYLPYAGVNPSLYSLCYQNPNIWADPSLYEAGNAANTAALVEGAIVEDWGAGKLGGFKGTFDGDGHYIHGLETSGDYSGFIVTMGLGGTIKNVAFTGAKIGANAGLVANRGQGAFENIYVEVESIVGGTSKDNFSHVIVRQGNNAERTYDNIVVDMSKVDVANLKYAYVIACAEAKANGVYVLGAENMLLARGMNEWTAGSDDTRSWTESEACVFWHYLEGDDVAGSFSNAAALLANETHGAVVKEWDSNLWTVTDTAVIFKSVVDMYSDDVAITNEETSVNAGTSAGVTTNLNRAYVALSLKEEVAGVTISGNTVTVAEDTQIGETFTVVATSLLNGTTTEMVFTVAPKIVNLADTMTVETYNNNTITLPDSVSGTVSKVTIGSTVVYDANKEFGSIDGKVVTVGAMPVAMSDLGDAVAMTVETNEAKYQMSVSVYTMIIDNAEELEQFYNVAADNALAAGLNIEAQKGFAQSGYFVLGADIEYNKVWTHIAYGTRWAACYQNKEIWKDQSLYKAGTAPAEDNRVDGAIVEDWGKGDKGGFHGVFDGKGHAIIGLELKGEYAGFIGTMGREGVLKNIAFTDLKVGQKAGLVERGGCGGFVENVYIELDSIESGVAAGGETKLFTQHGNTQLTNIIVNVTECDFTGIEYVYLLSSTYNVSTNIYVIDRDYIANVKTDWNTDKGAVAFWHFHPTNDSGTKFATVADMLADETHGAIVSSLGGYWKVEDGKLYFGDTEVVTAPQKEFDLTEYKTNIDKQVTLESESFTVDSVWSVSINGGEAVDFTVTEEGKATVTVDPATIDTYQAKVVFSNADKVLSFSNVIAVTYITNEAELKAIGMGENNKTATDHLKGYYALANDITFTHADDKSDVVAAGYHAAGYDASKDDGNADNGDNECYTHLWKFQGVFDGNGYKIDNMRVADGGIFGYAENATIKNLTLTNVHLIDSVPASISKQGGGYASILAYTAPGSTFENIEMTIASSPASVWTWKRDGLFVCSGSAGAATFRDITVDASYVELKTLLGISHNSGNVYENVLIKAASYAAIGYRGDSYGAGGVQNVAVMLTECPDGVTFEKVAHAEIPNNPMNTNLAKLSAYTGDVTALGFAEGSNVFEVTADASGVWNNRIVFPADSDNYDYVEFDVVLSTDISSFTAWPHNGDKTQGSMNIYGAQMQTSDGLVRTVQVWDKDGNTFKAQYTSGFKANTLYTIRVCFVEGETLKYLHLGMGTAQTYYVSNARWGTFGTQNDVYTSGTGALLAKYEGDVTALGFEAGSTVTQVTLADAWNNRVGVNGNIKYDYVDVKFSFTGDRTVYSLCVWAYGTNAAILTGNYSVSATGSAAANGASERTIQILDANGNAVEAMTANTVYTLRVYLNGDASTIAVSTFDTSAESTAILNFGDITYGNEGDNAGGDTTPEEITVNGLGFSKVATGVTATAVNVDGVNAWEVTQEDGITTARAYIDPALLAGKSTLTFSVMVNEEFTSSPVRLRVKPLTAQYIDWSVDTFTVGEWKTITVDLTSLVLEEGATAITEFAFHLNGVKTIYLKDITIS